MRGLHYLGPGQDRPRHHEARAKQRGGHQRCQDHDRVARVQRHQTDLPDAIVGQVPGQPVRRAPDLAMRQCHAIAKQGGKIPVTLRNPAILCGNAFRGLHVVNHLTRPDRSPDT